VSPHLDDAVFGCGDAIRARPGSVVVTVFAGAPAAWHALTPWDGASGFAPGEDAVARRRQEDRAALAGLGASPLWLPFLDAQYDDSPDTEAIAHAVAGAVHASGASGVVIPLGLWHSDQRLAHEGCALLIPRHPQLQWFAYEDAIYRAFPDSGLGDRLARLADRGVRATPLPAGAPASAAKRRSVECYASQLRALGGDGAPGWLDALAPERYWALDLA
jgi:LmbE family N-acetylglucosaminyl deacetylase